MYGKIIRFIKHQIILNIARDSQKKLDIQNNLVLKVLKATNSLSPSRHPMQFIKTLLSYSLQLTFVQKNYLSIDYQGWTFICLQSFIRIEIFNDVLDSFDQERDP